MPYDGSPLFKGNQQNTPYAKEQGQMTTKTLIRGGTVVSMDPQIGDLTGDVLIEDDKIVAVEPNISADAEVIDANDCIVIPGFVDTHRHTWEAAIRGCAPNATLDDYFVEVLDTFAPVYRAEDVHASNVAGSLECLNAGITTLVDWSHINNSPDHSDAAVTALRQTGIRAQYAYGSANLSLADYWFESKITIPGDDVRRVREKYFSSDDGLLTMALATRGSGFCMEDVVRAEWKLARELDIPITVHVAMGRLAGRFAMVKQLHDYGLLGPDTTYIHCCHFSDEEWQLVKDSGGMISVAPPVEMQMGHGWPPLLHARRLGLRPSLSIDVVTTVPGDMFTEMRAAFGADRARVHDEKYGPNEQVPKDVLTAQEILEAATIDGAYTAGLEDRTGSLTPGKQADVVIIEAKSLNMAPVIDPVAAVVLCADVSNVDTVLVAGQAKKRDGMLLADVDKARADVEASRDYLLEATAEKRQ
jgi:5-methylthioadenosine/S-adenosylhomocysteine deaminase